MAMKDDRIVHTTTYRDKKGRRKYYDISGVAVDDSGNGVGTINTPTKKQRQDFYKAYDRQKLGIKTVEQTQKTLKQANKEFDAASKRYENALSNELKKTGIDYRTRFEDMSKKRISYQTKDKDKPKNQPTPIPIVETSKKLKKELAEKDKAYNKWKIANYENNLAEVYDEKTTTWDKTGGNVTRALKDLVSPLTTGDDNVIYDENGNKTFLPSRSELKQQKVRSEMSGVGGALADIGYNATKILGAGAIDLATGGIGGKALYWTDMAADNYKNVRNQGYDNASAIANTIISTGSEFLTEKLMGGLAKPLTGAKISDTQKIFANAFTKATKNPRIANLLGSMTSEGLEEFTQEFIGALNNKITLGQDTNIDDLVQDALYSGLIGAGSGGLVTGAMGNVEGKIAEQQLGAMNNTLTDLNQLKLDNNSKRVTNAVNASQEFIDKPFTTDFNKAMETVGKLNEVERTRLTEITQKRLAGEMLDQNDLDTINYLNNREQMQTDLSNKVQEAPQELKPIDTSDKILNFRNSVENEGIQDADGFYKAAEKIIQDKDYNVIMDSSITNEKGKPVNAVISNENGITIRINPKSERAAEILLMHEVTHGIETKEMSNLIMNYASKNAEFNDALQSLKKAYGTEDITPEVVADISGQLLGRQDFINGLSTENPSIFKRIYDKIIELKNKLTGNSNYDNFVKDLAVKWERAYRKANTQSSQQNLKEGARYSENAEIGGKTKVDKIAIAEKRAGVEMLDTVMDNLIFDNEDVDYWLGKAKTYDEFYRLALEDEIPKEDIPKPTEKISEFVDDYEIEEWIDKDLAVEVRDTYKKYLDEYKNMTLRDFIEAHENAQTTKTSDEYKQIEGISLEDETKETTFASREDIRDYYIASILDSDIGELLSDKSVMKNIKDYQDFYEIALKNGISEDNIPSATDEMWYITDTDDLMDDFADENKEVNTGTLGEINSMTFEEFINEIKNPPQNKSKSEQNYEDLVLKEKNRKANKAKLNRTTDNDGNELSKGQQKFFDESEVRDENGALIKVYHTMTNAGLPFYEFNPVGTPNYKYGGQVVNFFTDNQLMSASYAKMAFEKANTKKYTNIKEIQEFLNELNQKTNDASGRWIVRDVSDTNHWDNYEKYHANELLRRFKRNTDEGIDGVKKLYDRGLITKKELEKATQPVKYVIYRSGDTWIDDTVTFTSEDDLFRNWNNELAKKMNEKLSFRDQKHNVRKWQYSGYLNMKNPYIVDSKGRGYRNAAVRYKKGVSEAFDSMSKYKNELKELADESINKFNENLDSVAELREYQNYISRMGYDEEGLLLNDKYWELQNILQKMDTLNYDGAITYNEIYNKAKEEGKDFPSPNTKMKDLLVSREADQFEKNHREKGKEILEMSLEDFVNNYYTSIRTNRDVGHQSSWFEKNYKKIVGDDINTELLNDYDWFEIANALFDEEAKETFAGEFVTTNAIVKYILEENKSLEKKYDGVIFKNLYDYGTDMMDAPESQILPGNVYVTFASNQFKADDNLNPTDDPDIRYSKEAKKWQDWLEKNFKNEGPKTVLKDHIKKSKKQIKKDMIDKGVKPKVAEILTETPRAEEKKSSLREDWHKLKRKFVDKGEAVYRLAKKTKNRLLYATYDKMGTSIGEANYHIGEAQTTLKGNAYRNFTDKDGKKVSMSLNQIWDGIDPKLANEYLAHYLNMDRYKQKNLSGENRYVFGESVTDKDSAKRVKELEKAHPELKRFGENVWQYGRNQLKNMVDSGIISKEQAEQFVLDTPHYVRLQRNVSKGSKNKIEVDKDGNAKVNKQIKEFKGSDLDILPFKDSMAQYTIDVIQSMRANLFGQELAKTLGMSSTNDTVESVDEIFGFNPDLIKDNEDGTYSFTVFNKGQAITLPIDEGIYEALQPNKKYDIEDAAIFSGKFGIRNADKFRRSLLTDKNPLFLATNMLKDLFDAPLNSQRPTAFVANYIPAIKQIVTNGKYYQQYKSLGGLQNTYFDKEGFTKQKSKWNPIGWAEKANNAVEQFPRLAEFMATMKATGNIDEAMYNAAEITTNFKRGGDITKAINRNGGTFLNASVQGFSRFVRNFSDIQNPQQAVKMLAKIVALGIGPALLNDMVYDDDDDYKDLQDYIKDNYYLIKGKNGTWIRIPKGRAVSVFQDAARRTKYRLRGDKDAFKGMWSTFKNQIAPNNVFDSNIASPFVQVANNKSWSGNPIVSDYTKNAKHPEEEYDVKTDELSKWLGKTFHLSPKKINYIIDQYSGVIGDFALPIGTKYAESKSDNPLYQAFVNPGLSKFTTNSVTSSKAQQEFYQALQDAEDDRYWSKGTSKDTAVHKYLSSKNREISSIRKEMTELQESNKPAAEKFEGALEYQKQINEIAKDAVKQSKKVNSTGEEFVIGGKYYSGPEANAVKSETVEKAKNIGLSVGDYIDVTAKYSDLKADKDSNGKTIPGSKKQKFIDYVNAKKELTEQQKIAIIQKYYKKYGGE